MQCSNTCCTKANIVVPIMGTIASVYRLHVWSVSSLESGGEIEHSDTSVLKTARPVGKPSSIGRWAPLPWFV